ncbi:ferredoxin--NADP reductase [Rhodococcoides yunnanense]|uniref:Ferredoxin--NADP reductase n=1 Tax=Rhodococcoides yunnanense TaxID=278209 RepID=A0ABU4BL28_9NOCA|nr:ferredoxin--NADP reductase [Rhodococcus yunnanensis]MDV6264922.1 ferredoxin--NADP reductase [Rhodococcus yunnanensis]
MPASSLLLTVADVIQETADAVTIVFERPDEGWSYRAGQFLTLRIPSDRTGSVARCYSLSSSPNRDRQLMVTVKRTVGGYASNWLCDNIGPGDQIESLVPSGVFSPKDFDRDLLLVGAGSGITPLLSIAKTALAEGSGRVVLLYANRDPESVIYASSLRTLVDAMPERLTAIHWLESVQGLPGVAALAGLLRPYSEFEAFICGPKPFMKGARHALADIGVPRSKIHVENFLSLSEDPFAASKEPIVDGGASDVGVRASSVLVQIDGRSLQFAWPRSKTLIDMLLENGIEAPYSCREGECGSCQCTLLSGKVEMMNVGALDEEDIADGLVLGCQAHPASDQIEIEF